MDVSTILAETRDAMQAVFDGTKTDDGSHRASLDKQRAKLRDPDCTPSARVLDTMRAHDNSFMQFSLAQSQAHAAQFRARPLTPTQLAAYREQARHSIDAQTRMENEQSGNFDDYIESYRARSLMPTGCD